MSKEAKAPAAEPIRAVCNPGTPLALDKDGLPMNALTGQPYRVPGNREESDWDIGLRHQRDTDRINEWTMLSSTAKTQLCSDLRYKEGEPFTVSVPGDRAQVTVNIRASSAQEAIQRYRELCGIGACDHEIVASKATGGKTAKQSPKDAEEPRPVSTMGIEAVEEVVQ